MNHCDQELWIWRKRLFTGERRRYALTLQSGLFYRQRTGRTRFDDEECALPSDLISQNSPVWWRKAVGGKETPATNGDHTVPGAKMQNPASIFVGQTDVESNSRLLEQRLVSFG